MDRQQARRRIDEIGIVPCARVAIAEQVCFAAKALYAAGIPVLEVTLTFPEAPKVVGEIARRYPDMAVGAGTVLDEDSARRSIDAGARFITSPGLVPKVVACAKAADVLVIPGALTPTEVIAAWQSGADLVKIFPVAAAGGIHYVHALRAPLPQVPLIVSGGVNQLTAFDYILAGASAIGIGGELLPSDALARQREDRIHELARRFLAMVREARSQRDANGK